MIKKIILLISSLFIFFSYSFATSYSISKNDYDKIQKINQKIERIIKKKYSGKERYVYQVLIDSIDGYIALHPKLSERKKILLLCVKTYFLEKLGYKSEDTIRIYIK